MHIDETKRFDRRNIEKNVKDGMISPKDYEIYLSRLPDVSEKAFLGEEPQDDSVEITPEEDDGRSKKAESKKKNKGKGK
jgi:hypothetical protein